MMEKEWWKNKIAEDIYDMFRTKEQLFSPFRGHSPQLWARRHLVDWLGLVVERYGLDVTSQHLAVHLLDYFMDKLEVDQNHLYLLAVSCLIIAVKYEEHCDKTPGLDGLNSLIPKHSLLDMNYGYTKSELLTMEITVLNFFDWSLSKPTVAQFLPYFLQVAVDTDDLLNGVSLTSTSKKVLEACVAKHAAYFQEISLQDQYFREYPPSLVAAACITASRIVLNLTPTWPKQLELMTDYYLEELLPCVHCFRRFQVQDQSSSSPYHDTSSYQMYHSPAQKSATPSNPAILPVYCSYTKPSHPFTATYSAAYTTGAYPDTTVYSV